MKARTIIILNVLILFLGIFAIVIGSYLWKQQEVQQDAQRLTALNHLVLGAAVKPTDITIDYSRPTSTGSPLIFGGAGYPDISQQDAWNKMQDTGVNMIRTDLAMNYMIRNTTLADYKNNVNNIQDISNWNNYDLQKKKSVFEEAKKRGMKTIGIVDYTPPWLAYDNTDFGVPKDWTVFEDVVGKIYLYYRNDLDYVEIWNEPEHPSFLTLGNSNMTREQAYQQIFYHAAKAIRAVDQKANDGKTASIGGPVNSTPDDTSILKAIVANKDTKSIVSFISYHDYTAEDPSNTNFMSVLKQYGMGKYPLFITEWNYDGNSNIDNPSKTGIPAMFYTANKFISFLKMGITGANYYSLESVRNNSQYLAFYTWNNNQATLLPQAKIWRIFEKDMGLGKGASKIYASQNNPTTINTVGFSNISQQQGVVLVNDSPSPSTINLHLKRLGNKTYVKLAIYYASEGNDATIPIYVGTVATKNNTLTFPVSIPPATVAGVIFGEEKQWFDLLHLFN